MSTDAFDPYAILRAIADHDVDCVLVGALARVVRGSSEITSEVEIVIETSVENMRRLDDALRSIGMTGHVGNLPGPVRFTTMHGEVVALGELPGRDLDYRILARTSPGEHLGDQLRVRVATGAELVRQLGAAGDDRFYRHGLELETMERTLERSRTLER